MWVYEKKMEYPVRIKRRDPKLAKLIISQYGGPDGELGASLRYLSQRYTMVTPQAIATLNDIGISWSEMAQSNASGQDKPRYSGFLLHTFSANQERFRYGESGKGKIKWNIRIFI